MALVAEVIPPVVGGTTIFQPGRKTTGPNPARNDSSPTGPSDAGSEVTMPTTGDARSYDSLGADEAKVEVGSVRDNERPAASRCKVWLTREWRCIE